MTLSPTGLCLRVSDLCVKNGRVGTVPTDIILGWFGMLGLAAIAVSLADGAHTCYLMTKEVLVFGRFKGYSREHGMEVSRSKADKKVTFAF